MDAAIKSHQRVLRFAAVGIVNTLIDITIYTGLHLAGLSIVLANLISTSLALIVSFALNSRFTFNDRKLTRNRTIIYFAVTIFGLWILQPITISLLTHLNHVWNYTHPATAIIGHPKLIDSLVPKLGATVVTLIWNYGWYNRVIYK